MGRSNNDKRRQRYDIPSDGNPTGLDKRKVNREDRRAIREELKNFERDINEGDSVPED